MPTLIFDIETVGEDFDAMDEVTQAALTHWIEREAEDEAQAESLLADVKNRLGFSPLTGEIVAVGVLDAEQNRGAVYFQAPNATLAAVEEDGIKFQPCDEQAILKHFWDVAAKYDQFVSFNGRAFDAPFLMVRSAVHGIRPSKNLMSNRYLSMQRSGAVHIDLLDQLSFYGAAGKGSLHLWSRAFGIPSPKASGVTGDDVARLFREEKFLELARYNVGDLRATKALYATWRDYLML